MTTFIANVDVKMNEIEEIAFDKGDENSGMIKIVDVFANRTNIANVPPDLCMMQSRPASK
jgi:hypothetical protein